MSAPRRVRRSDPTGDEGRVHLRMPANADYLVLARQTAATLAAHAGMLADTVDDGRLLADEAMTQLISWGADQIDIDLRVDDGTLSIAMIGIGATEGPVNELAWSVLTALASDLSLTAVDGHPCIRLRIGPAPSR